VHDRLHELTALQMASGIRAGEMTSTQVVNACLDRIADREEQVRAWAHIDREHALAAARRRDAQPPVGPLHGVPVGVKDLIDTADAPTAYGSSIYAGHRPAVDAACVRRLREAGAVVLGKTVTTEFALFHPGPTANPCDLTRTPGGSSSGSAAAVADHMAPLALGTQTAGSIVRPASFCGIYGFKPTFGAIDTAGVKAIGPTLDTLGPLARDVDDLAVAAGIMADGVPWDVPASPPAVAFARTHQWARAAPATRDALTALAERLAVPEVALPDDFADLVEAQTLIMGAEAAAALDVEHRSHPDRLSDDLRTLLARGREIRRADVEEARALADRCRRALPTVFADHPVLVVPSAIGEAPVGLGATGDPLFCRMWTLLGTPAVAVAGLRGPDGLPLGVQVVADRHHDTAALAAARWLGGELAKESP
jgi:Asp-tRNA(Asn)/Glu-tRNA(Gln) amidotransferase A subunit family amidase